MSDTVYFGCILAMFMVLAGSPFLAFLVFIISVILS